MCNRPRSDLVLADCVRFWPNGSGPNASRRARILGPVSGQAFRADPVWVQMLIGCSLGRRLLTCRNWPFTLGGEDGSNPAADF